MRLNLTSHRWRYASLAIGIMLLGYSASGIFRNRMFLMNAAQADGTVVSIASSGVPVIRYKSESGALVDWVAANQRGIKSIETGGHVPILYLPEQPGAAVVGRTWSVIARLVGPGVLGLFLMIYGRRVLIARS